LIIDLTAERIEEREQSCLWGAIGAMMGKGPTKFLSAI
jgi:hypothetical protein